MFKFIGNYPDIELGNFNYNGNGKGIFGVRDNIEDNWYTRKIYCTKNKEWYIKWKGQKVFIEE